MRAKLSIRSLSALSIVLLVSCSRNATTPAPASGTTTETAEQPADSQSATAAPAQPTAQPIPITDTNSNAVLDQLSFALRKYCVENRRVPKTFDEFAATGVVQIPPAPAGKKYALEPRNLRVILVSN